MTLGKAQAITVATRSTQLRSNGHCIPPISRSIEIVPPERGFMYRGINQCRFLCSLSMCGSCGAISGRRIDHGLNPECYQFR